MIKHLASKQVPKGVREETQLSLQSLVDLINGEILGLRVKKFCPSDYSDAIAKKLLTFASFERYGMGEDVPVQRMGMTLFETENRPELLKRYLSDAIGTIKTFREIVSPYRLPLDDLRLELEELWPEGARIGKLEGNKMLPGIARMFEADASSGLPPHQDILSRDLPRWKKARNMKAQIAANIYLKTPPEGGELELWDYSPTQEEYHLLRNGHHDFLDRKKLPSSNALIKPEVGELILMRSDHVHAVLPSRGGSRVAMSCFIGYYGYEHPLIHWA